MNRGRRAEPGGSNAAFSTSSNGSQSRDLKKPPAKAYLADAVDFSAYVRRHAPELEAPAALQALGGLRLQEAYRLTWDKIDLDGALVEISGEVKTDWSRRVIPICARALQALQRAHDRREKARIRLVGPEAPRHRLRCLVRLFPRSCPSDEELESQSNLEPEGPSQRPPHVGHDERLPGRPLGAVPGPCARGRHRPSLCSTLGFGESG